MNSNSVDIVLVIDVKKTGFGDLKVRRNRDCKASQIEEVVPLSPVLGFEERRHCLVSCFRSLVL